MREPQFWTWVHVSTLLLLGAATWRWELRHRQVLFGEQLRPPKLGARPLGWLLVSAFYGYFCLGFAWGGLGEHLFPGIEQLGLRSKLGVLLQFGGMLLGIAVAVRILRLRLQEDFAPPPTAAAAAHGIRLFLLLIPLVAGLFWATRQLLPLFGGDASEQRLVSVFDQTESAVELFILICTVVVVVPIAEELLFRAIIQRLIERAVGPVAAILLSSALFAAVHSNSAAAPALFVFSIFLGVAFRKSGDIRVPIVAHLLFNLNGLVSVAG